MKTEKPCNKCGVLKPLEEFRTDKRKRDGRGGQCRACVNRASVEYQKKNPEKAYALTKAWRERNKEAHSLKRREWTKTPKAQATRQAWIDANRERLYLYNRARKAMRRGMRKKVTIAHIDALMEMQKRMCVACHADLKNGYHVDHIMPVALGGDSATSNLQLLCPSCNCSKRASHPIDFMQRMGRLL